MAIFNSFSSMLQILSALFLKHSQMSLQPSNMSGHRQSLLLVVGEKRVNEKWNILSTKIWNLRKVNDASAQRYLHCEHLKVRMYMFIHSRGLNFENREMAMYTVIILL